MAKVPIARLNTAPKIYEKTDFDQLIEDLQDMIKISKVDALFKQQRFWVAKLSALSLMKIWKGYGSIICHRGLGLTES